MPDLMIQILVSVRVLPIYPRIYDGSWHPRTTEASSQPSMLGCVALIIALSKCHTEKPYSMITEFYIKFSGSPYCQDGHVRLSFLRLSSSVQWIPEISWPRSWVSNVQWKSTSRRSRQSPESREILEALKTHNIDQYFCKITWFRKCCCEVILEIFHASMNLAAFEAVYSDVTNRAVLRL